MTLLQSNREELYLAKLNEILYTVRGLALAGGGALLLLLAGLADFLGRHFPSEVQHLQTTRVVGVLAGVFFLSLASFEAIRSSDTRYLIRAATKPPAEDNKGRGA